nr:hypothetical protein [Tanacetum cinerariifolium]
MIPLQGIKHISFSVRFLMIKLCGGLWLIHIRNNMNLVRSLQSCILQFPSAAKLFRSSNPCLLDSSPRKRRNIPYT